MSFSVKVQAPISPRHSTVSGVDRIGNENAVDALRGPTLLRRPIIASVCVCVTAVTAAHNDNDTQRGTQ